MNDRGTAVNSWEQLTMLQPEVYEITLRVGCVPMEDHYQLQLEWKDAKTDDLLGVESRHHVGDLGLDSSLDHFLARLRAVIESARSPF